MEQILIRDMREQDIPAVAQIERTSFSTPWSEISFLNEIRKPHSAARVAALNDKVVGYACIEFIEDEAHILNLAVHPDYRKAGIAASLVETVIEESRLNACAFLYLEVRASNYIAKSLYEGFGFEVIGVRKRYYVSPEEDAIIMRLKV